MRARRQRKKSIGNKKISLESQCDGREDTPPSRDKFPKHSPCEEFSRRVAILYSAGYFVCRHCLQLAYEPHYRALHKAQAIHEKLGGTGIIDDPVFRPKGMHWRTYSRYFERFREAESRAVTPWLFGSFS